jgi:TRAP-type C4-dicarboxylate transport system permease large subunit
VRKTNDVTGSRLRRQLADDVKISGNAVMLMGVWTFVKVFARSFFARQELYEQLKEFELPNSVILLVMFIMLTVFGAVFQHPQSFELFSLFADPPHRLALLLQKRI